MESGMIVRVMELSGSGFDAFLTGTGVPEIFEVNGSKPHYVLATGPGGDLIATHPEKEEGMIGPMFDGRFMYSSDSRFQRLNGGHPIRLHDRFETPQEYERMSR